ncbi:YihY/virulence factor BrkB family protein [Desulforhopalus sp. IMCC35007]|uniref:YihY/virulence factor BrkB family protein n=1 Tax=Desulforhopalus sp. IMCC35007 TaxID=2569543 RepID=UPI0010ADF7A2|nr:YihY/virulence factor BrkB family protein [Desulforhopalus sp. IMCC35007]TKB06738.1 YihY/virulence factor BrkB family protein [Desulforhopalus sp. IMCC35007]
MEYNLNQLTRAWSSYLNWLDDRQSVKRWPIELLRYFLRLLYITVHQFRANDLSLRSGALTYTILLSMVPMLAMSTAVIKGLGGGDQLREAAYTYVKTLEKTDSKPDFKVPQTGPTNHVGKAGESDQSSLTNFPPTTVPPDGEASLTTHLRSAVSQLFDYVDRTNFATLGTFGVIGMFFSVVLVLGNIETAMNSIWRVTAGRPVLRKIADYLTLLILLPLSTNLALAATAFIKNPKLADKIDIYIPLDWIQAPLLQALPIVFITISFYVMFIFFPNTKVKTLPALIGASLAACFWVIIQNIYITLQIGVAKYNAIYGSFATFPLFLVWIYLSWIFILAGAQIAYAIQNEKKYSINDIPATPAMKLSAAFDIMDEVFQAFSNGEELTRQRLSALLGHYPPKMLRKVSKTLIKNNLISYSDKDKRFLPLFPKVKYNQADVVQAILGDDVPDSKGGQESRKVIHAAMGLD